MEINSEYYYTFEQFCEAHPDVDPEWEETVWPVFDDSQTQMLRFIMGYML